MKKPDRKQDHRLIHRALDGDITKSETKRLKTRMQADGRLRDRFEQMKHIVKETTRLRINVPKDFTSKVLDETRRLRRPQA